MRFLLISRHSWSILPSTNPCLYLLWKVFANSLKYLFLLLSFEYVFEYPILNKFLKKIFSSVLFIFSFLFFIKSCLFNVCHIPILFLNKYSHGNFSPGSFFLSVAISECPKIFLGLILYFFIKNLLSFKSEVICFCVNFL